MSTEAASLSGAPRTERPAHWPARLAWSLCGVTVASILAYLWLGAANDDIGSPVAVAMLAAAFLSFAVVGALVASRQLGNQVGWLLIAVGAGAMTANAAQQYATYGLETSSGSLPGAHALAWLGGWGWYAAMAMVLFVILLFPTGRLPSRRWRPVLWFDVGAVTAILASLMFAPGPIEGRSETNPLGIEPLAGLFSFLNQSAGVLLLVVLASSAAAITVRARRASGEERQQLKWLAFGAAIFAFTVTAGSALVEWLGAAEAGDAAWGLGLAAIPTSMGVAILRHRLYDLTIVVNRSLVYVALTASVIALYIGFVTLFERTLGRSGQTGALVATGIVAVAFQPLRERLQRGINRLMYGERDEPYAVLSKLAARLELALPAQQTLGTVTETIAGALRLPYAAIELRQDDGYVPGAAFGEPATPAMTLRLTHQGEEVGRLLVAPRSPGEDFSAADRRLLEDLARQAGVAVYSARLTDELQRSRARLVAALEDERRRIRRDLHDGLGPTLAATLLEIQATTNLLQDQPEAARELLEKMAIKTKSSIAEIRRLVYGLRPPALDELGLASAITEQASRLETQGDGLRVTVDADGDLTQLPAAVEVAAYRIALEALTNAARHARAQACSVRLALADELVIEVDDNGIGVAPEARWGVGLASMRERCEELGGTFEVRRRDGGGTRLRAELPVDAA